MTPPVPVDGPQMPDGEPLSGIVLKDALHTVIAAASAGTEDAPAATRGPVVAAIDIVQQFAAAITSRAPEVSKFTEMQGPADHLIVKAVDAGYLLASDPKTGMPNLAAGHLGVLSVEGWVHAIGSSDALDLSSETTTVRLAFAPHSLPAFAAVARKLEEGTPS